MTKMLLVADYENANWKLRRVNELYGDLVRCREVLKEEVNRLERRKRFYTVTDHIYHHDGRFVDNELRLQDTLTMIDRFNEQIQDQRERRVALAFITELFAPDGEFRALDWEERDLLRERAVLETERHRLDLLFEDAEPNTHKRVALERQRQWVLAAIDASDRQLEDVVDARATLQTMTNSTEVIHRQGDTRLLTTTFLAEDLPFRVREAVERAALMTVRLQAADNVFTPRKTSVANANAWRSSLGK